MTRFLAAVAALTAMLVAAVPARADATAVTMNLHDHTFTLVVPLTCAGPFAGHSVLVVTGNGIEHLTVNSNGSWATGTIEGSAVLKQVFPSGAMSMATGHAQTWFGDENNRQNGVEHATLNFVGNDSASGARLEMHGNFDVTMNADGSVTASHFDVHCS